MPSFNAIDRAPGVYYEEVQLPGLIAGVGTSTAAFIGPAWQGPINRPVEITNPTQFTEQFGDHIPAPMVYVSHALQGFFENGGTRCYFVRVATAARASLPLNDRGAAPQPTLVVSARREGVAGNTITVQVTDSSLATTTAARSETTVAAPGASGTTARVTDASAFMPGDVVTFLAAGAGGAAETATVASVDTSTTPHSLLLVRPLANPATAGATVRIADIPIGGQSLRLTSLTGIEIGSYVTISQATAAPASEDHVVGAIVPATRTIRLERGLANAFTMVAADPPVQVQTKEFALTVRNPGTGDETFNNLAMDARHPRYFAQAAQFTQVELALASPPSPQAPLANLPAAMAAAAPLQNGADDNVAALTASHYTNGIDALQQVRDVNLVCVPDRQDAGVQQYLTAHCREFNRFAILDSQRNAGPSNGVRIQRNALTADNGHAALYFPWIRIRNPAQEGTILVPPSGHVAGVFARTDSSRGVHKAPANEVLEGVLGFERTLTDTEIGLLNEQSVNVLRFFPGRGMRIWGARTLATRTQWRYVNVRRLVTYIEQSLIDGTQSLVFEPNNLGLWQQIRRIVNAFLTQVWRDGALFGATPEDAFRIKVDAELNPPSVRQLGQLFIEVTLFPTTPAEFIIFRIIQEPGGPTVVEVQP